MEVDLRRHHLQAEERLRDDEERRPSHARPRAGRGGDVRRQPRGPGRDGLRLRERRVLRDDSQDDKGHRGQAGGDTLEAGVRGRPPNRWRASSTTLAETSLERRSSSSTPRPRPGAATPPAEIFRVCRKRGVLTVLDAISTFGGMEVKMDEWGADYVIGYASKALGGIFGAQPVAIGKASWEAAKQNKARIHSLFLDLNTWSEAIEQGQLLGAPVSVLDADLRNRRSPQGGRPGAQGGAPEPLQAAREGREPAQRTGSPGWGSSSSRTTSSTRTL